MILNKPSVNLDIRAREDFLMVLHNLKEAGKAMVFSSHRLGEVTALADRVLLLGKRGKLVVDARLLLGGWNNAWAGIPRSTFTCPMNSSTRPQNH
ncbi:MAG: hypothetical protein M5U34_15890 [Chloroflexi bacterium]|nr:hypothetical protein [Chloroflexota bacterium]